MRVPEEVISRKRNKRDTVFLLTGGTGFLGSHIAGELLKRGYRVILVCRSTRHASPLQRVNRLLDWLRIDRGTISPPEIMEGDLAKPNLGLSDSRYTYLLKAADEIVHCAGSTSFFERKRAEIEGCNLEALEHVLKLAVDGSCSYFHHVSTAYVAGKRSGICDETLGEADQFNNVYEETKHRAELHVSRVCEREGIRVNIYRPSIVYGNWKTGKSLKFNGLYYPIKALLFLKDVYEKDIRNNGGRKADKMGIRIENDGSFYLPIRIEEHKEGQVDLISIDYFVDSFMTLMHACLDNGIFHIVADRQKTISELLHYTRNFFHLKGISAVSREDLDKAPKNALEILYGSYLHTYHPYIQDTRTFSSEKTKSLLRRHHVRCPDFTFSVFARCMEYAVEVDWGKKLR